MKEKKQDSSMALWVLALILLTIILLVLIFLIYRQEKRKREEVTSKEAQELLEGPSLKRQGFYDYHAEERSDMSISAVSFGESWLELPAKREGQDDTLHFTTHWAEMEGRQQRNYSYLYDNDTYISYWVAYPLCTSHTTTGREETWGYDPSIDKSSQTSVVKGYGASQATTNYPKNFYARGHQVPNADRNAVLEMQAQTYYSTNMTPQLQNGFNGAIWAKLEEAVRGAIPASSNSSSSSNSINSKNLISASDTLYIVTGAAFSKIGEDLKINTIVNKNDGKILPVPNYYWKVVLKVKRDSIGKPTAATTIGFWLPHDDLKGHSYTSYAVSVDQIEEWLGFDFFTNLSPSLQETAESNSDWSAFLAW